LNVVDSSAWLEYFGDGPRAADFARPIVAVDTLIVPTLTLFEVFKRLLVQRGEDAALQGAAIMRQGKVVELDGRLALESARLSVELGLPMADSIVYATARSLGATLWTQDADFADLPGVRYLPKR
jgi:predicted nucleic acid-binding protein